MHASVAVEPIQRLTSPLVVFTHKHHAGLWSPATCWTPSHPPESRLTTMSCCEDLTLNTITQPWSWGCGEGKLLLWSHVGPRALCAKGLNLGSPWYRFESPWASLCPRASGRPRWAFIRLECQQTCFIIAPKTGPKKLVEIWRPERDLDCTRNKLGRTERKSVC